MPTEYVKKLAEEHNMSVAEAEKKWEQAKKKASEEGTSKEYFAYVTAIFKNMMHESNEAARSGGKHASHGQGSGSHAAHSKSSESKSGSHASHGSKSSGSRAKSTAKA